MPSCGFVVLCCAARDRDRAGSWRPSRGPRAASPCRHALATSGQGDIHDRQGSWILLYYVGLRLRRERRELRREGCIASLQLQHHAGAYREREVSILDL